VIINAAAYTAVDKAESEVSRRGGAEGTHPLQKDGYPAILLYHEAFMKYCERDIVT